MRIKVIHRKAGQAPHRAIPLPPPKREAAPSAIVPIFLPGKGETVSIYFSVQAIHVVISVAVDGWRRGGLVRYKKKKGPPSSIKPFYEKYILL